MQTELKGSCIKLDQIVDPLAYHCMGKLLYNQLKFMWNNPRKELFFQYGTNYHYLSTELMDIVEYIEELSYYLKYNMTDALEKWYVSGQHHWHIV